MRLKICQNGWVQLPADLLEREELQAGDLAEIRVSRAGPDHGPFRLFQP